MPQDSIVDLMNELRHRMDGFMADQAKHKANVGSINHVASLLGERMQAFDVDDDLLPRVLQYRASIGTAGGEMTVRQTVRKLVGIALDSIESSVAGGDLPLKRFSRLER